MPTAIFVCYTVKRVDEVVRHPHLVTQDQFTQVSKKVSDIPEENFTINIELFRQNFSNVELLRQKWIFWKVTSTGHEPMSSDLHSSTLPLRHTFFLIQVHTEAYHTSFKGLFSIFLPGLVQPIYTTLLTFGNGYLHACNTPYMLSPRPYLKSPHL